MAKKSYLKKNKDSFFNMMLLFVVFILASLLIPAIGADETAPSTWLNIVNFFTDVKLHFSSFWMFYSFALVAFLAFFKK